MTRCLASFGAALCCAARSPGGQGQGGPAGGSGNRGTGRTAEAGQHTDAAGACGSLAAGLAETGMSLSRNGPDAVAPGSARARAPAAHWLLVLLRLKGHVSESERQGASGAEQFGGHRHNDTHKNPRYTGYTSQLKTTSCVPPIHNTIQSI